MVGSDNIDCSAGIEVGNLKRPSAEPLTAPEWRCRYLASWNGPQSMWSLAEDTEKSMTRLENKMGHEEASSV